MFRVPASRPQSAYGVLIAFATTLAALSCANEGVRPNETQGATRLVFLVQPAGANAGGGLGTVEVAFEDADGSLVSSASGLVTIAVTGGAATLNGTTSIAASSGMATFPNLSIEKAGSGYTLTATAGSLTPAVSNPFTITAAAPAKLAFVVQPTSAAAGAVISPAPQIAVHDAFGNLASTATSAVTLGITSGTGTAGAALSGTTNRSAVAGMATFDDVAVSTAGTGYTLTASAAGLTSATSNSFSVTALAAADCANPAPGWIFCDDFETDRLASYFEYTTDGDRFSRVNGVGRNGGYGMRARFDAGTVSAGSLKLAFGRTPDSYIDPVDAGTLDYREIYWRFYFRNQPGWTGGGGDKLTRITVFATKDWAQAMIGHVWSGEGSDANYLILDPASGTDAAGNLKTTTYNDFPNLRFLGIARSTTPIFDAQRVGEWYCIESRVKLNTAGQSDGVFELRINGTVEASKTGLNWLGSYSAFGLNAIFLESYWNDGSPVAQERYFDDFVVSTNPIGCS